MLRAAPLTQRFLKRWVSMQRYPALWMDPGPLDVSIIVEPTEASDHASACPVHLVMDVVKS